jgi:Pyruvate/2-oxoacid:ferredoxin oxidoreductase gamma subunit
MAKKRVDKGVPGMELLVCRNPKAAKRYDIEERLEAGMVLYGTEVKSLRARRGNLEAAYCRIDNDELFLYGMHGAANFSYTSAKSKGSGGGSPRAAMRWFRFRSTSRTVSPKLS